MQIIPKSLTKASQHSAGPIKKTIFSDNLAILCSFLNSSNTYSFQISNIKINSHRASLGIPVEHVSEIWTKSRIYHSVNIKFFFLCFFVCVCFVKKFFWYTCSHLAGRQIILMMRLKSLFQIIQYLAQKLIFSLFSFIIKFQHCKVPPPQKKKTCTHAIKLFTNIAQNMYKNCASTVKVR